VTAAGVRARMRAWIGAAAPFVARGGALFTAAIAMLAVIAELRGRTSELSLWWVDLRDLAAPVRVAFLVLVPCLLVTWALRPRPGRRLRRATAAVCLVIALLAVRDIIGFARAIGAGQVRPMLPVPLSAVLALLYATLAVHALRDGRQRDRLAGRPGLALLAAAGVWAVLFPLAQMLWFGTTDYRRPADAAVTFGARVYASGQPSPLLAARIDTAVELYRSGLVPVLVMSGGDGADGFNEARVMADVAVAAGVDPSAIVIDASGNTTEATVGHSIALLTRPDGAVPLHLIAVSQPYHLPRVQLAYSNEGIDVITVPAADPEPPLELVLFSSREIPAFWTYLLRVCLGW
jgi:vancomycin permeability regulator SanA